VLDREIDFVRVIRLALTIALNYGDCHVCFSSCAPQQGRNSMRKLLFHALRSRGSKNSVSAV
jgi:hypothetical protein